MQNGVQKGIRAGRSCHYRFEFNLPRFSRFCNSFCVSLQLSQTSAPRLSVPADRTFFHITHWKAGSQWIRGILQEAFGDALLTGDYFTQEGLASRLEQGKVYTGLYFAKQEFDAMDLPANRRRVVVIRDLRDTLISGYFSIRYSHGVTPAIRNWRRVLDSLSEEDGLLYLMESWLKSNAVIQRSWLEAGERCLKLEDFMSAPEEQMANIFESWGISIEGEWLNCLMERHAYQKYSGGRKPGEENVKSHYRKGVHGDWRSHFTPKVTARFKKLYSDILILGGYEAGESW
jgi:hypothetical protein